MNPPGKALKNGTPAAARPASPPTSGTAPVFRVIGGLNLVLGLCLGGYGLANLKEAGGLMLSPALAILFSSALMFALAEALTRLASIEAALRRKE